MKYTKIVTQTLLISIIIFGILILPVVIFNISFTKFILTKISFVIPFVVLSLIFSFTLIKSRIAGIIVILSFVLFLSLISIVIKNSESEYEEEVLWSSNVDEFTTDFIVGKQGYLYFKAQINNVTGLFLFDTGCSLTSVNEKFITNGSMKRNRHTISDSNGMKQTKHSHIVNKFELGNIEIRNLKTYPLDSLTWTSSDGIFFEQDSVIGVLGNNIISKFIWDFDFLNQCVTISNNKNYCDTISDSLSINLVSKNNCKEIPVIINQTDKLLLLDFGCSSPIILSDSIPERKELNKKAATFSQKRGKGALSHLDSINNNQTINGSFVDIKLGKFEYKKIRCANNNHSNLLGIPFIWSFERVVLDFSNNKTYFISENNEASKFSIKNHNWQSIINKGEIIELYSKPDGTLIKMENQSMEVRYMVFGHTKLYKNKGRLDSMFCQDSIHLPNGQTINGPITIKLNE